jgi:hypothetical protein
MFSKGMDTAAAKQQELSDIKDKQKEEYKQRLERQEDRMDKTQDKALDYTTRSNKPAMKEGQPKPASNEANSKPANKPEKKSCKKCNFSPLENDAKFCPECGNEPN